ncbi:MAG: YkvA family protein [Blastocatellia bacterium]
MQTYHERRQARSVLKDALMLIPNFLKLLVRLFKDSRVPTTEKALVAGAIVYVISPIDVIPDLIPFVGQVDDVYLVSLTLLRLLSRSGDDVLREHWGGAGDLASVVDKIVRAARYVLPKRVQEILLGRVEVAPKIKGGLLSSPAAPERIDSIEAIRQRRRE